MSDQTLSGGCLCCAVRFELSAPPYTAGYCHCTRCQRRTGTGAFNSDPGIRPSWRAFVVYSAPWEPLPDDGLERFAEAKPCA